MCRDVHETNSDLENIIACSKVCGDETFRVVKEVMRPQQTNEAGPNGFDFANNQARGIHEGTALPAVIAHDNW
jgi:hypothetical protein